MKNSAFIAHSHRTRRILAAFLALFLLLSAGTLVSCGKDDGEKTADSGKNDDKKFTDNDTGEKNLARFTVKDYGDILIELYPETAPITVANFKKLVSEGFYDGIIFHRIVPGFVIQGGDPDGTGYGGSKETIKGEFAANGVNNPLSHTRGVVSMARTTDPNSASSQFFIVLSDDYTAALDGSYAAFGKVIEGMDVADKIAAVKTDTNDKPISDVVIEKAVMESAEK